MLKCAIFFFFDVFKLCVMNKNIKTFMLDEMF